MAQDAKSGRETFVGFVTEGSLGVLKRLGQWICDSCGDVIMRAEDGWLEWKHDADQKKNYGWKIVHHSNCSPRGTDGCYHYVGHLERQDAPLRNYLGHPGRILLLSDLDPVPYERSEYSGPEVRHLPEWAELFRRLQFPHYEEARLYWELAQECNYVDANDAVAYSEETCIRIIQDLRRRELP